MLPLSVKRFLKLCGLLFILATIGNLNGSSTELWKQFFTDAGSPTGLIFSTPKTVRSDEFEVWTPAVIAQSRLQPAFPDANPSLGPGKVPLLYNMPVRHYTMLFRPQLWGYFFLDIEHGFAWHWNAKIFGLLASMLLLIFRITRRADLAIFGSLWILFSSYTQWWFSCPPMLPEMLASWALAVLCSIEILTSPSHRRCILFSIGLIFSGMNFVLCMYPPFQIPLLYLGVAIIAGTLWTQHREGPASHHPGRLWLPTDLLLIAAFITPLLIECIPTLHRIADTAYPGLRRSQGGELMLHHALSGILDFFVSESHFPDGYDEVNQAANFYPIWIPALLLLARQWYQQRSLDRLSLCVLLVLVFLLFYTICTLPVWFCKFTLLSMTTSTRCLMGIGMAGIFLTLFALRNFEFSSRPLPLRTGLILTLLLVSLNIGFLYFQKTVHPNYLTTATFASLTGINTLLIATFLLLPGRIFWWIFIGILIASNGFVNPVMRGLGPLYKASPLQELTRLQSTDPTAAWVAYESNDLSEFLMSAGLHTRSGLKIVPDMDLYAELDPSRSLAHIYNRYSFAYFVMPPNRYEVATWGGAFPSHVLAIHPTHPVLRKKDIRFFVFPHRIPSPEAEGLTIISAMPEHRIWIYQLATPTPTSTPTPQ